MPETRNGFSAGAHLKFPFLLKLANPQYNMYKIKIALIISNYCQQFSLSAHRL